MHNADSQLRFENEVVGSGADKQKHFYWLDLIRFVAAFAVLACHFRGAFFVDYSSLPVSQQNVVTQVFYLITRLGHEAVMVFFVLSGFLVGGKAIERISAGSFKVRDYAIDRAVRIMLPLISSLLLYAVIAAFCGIYVPPLAWIGSLLSLQGVLTPSAFETLWSLSYEVWFYILAGALGVVFTRGSRRGFASLLLLLVAMVFTKLQASYLFVWLIGAFAYYMLGSARRATLYVTLALSLVGILAMQMSAQTNTADGVAVSDSSRAVIEICFGAIFALFITQVIQFEPRHGMARFINRLGSKLAAFSYTLYLTHIPIRDLLVHLGAPKSTELTIISVGLYLLWVGLAMLVAYVIYYLFERNTSQVKRWLKTKLSR